jgi:hypothetical protein
LSPAVAPILPAAPEAVSHALPKRAGALAGSAGYPENVGGQISVGLECRPNSHLPKTIRKKWTGIPDKAKSAIIKSLRTIRCGEEFSSCSQIQLWVGCFLIAISIMC